MKTALLLMMLGLSLSGCRKDHGWTIVEANNVEHTISLRHDGKIYRAQCAKQDACPMLPANVGLHVREKFRLDHMSDQPAAVEINIDETSGYLYAFVGPDDGAAEMWKVLSVKSETKQ